MENKSKELEVAIEAALEAGKVLKKYFDTKLFREFKEDASVVTVADKESEEVVKKIISGYFPDHSILGEETGHTQNTSDFTWHIDPLDGTTNFSNGLPIFAVSIALEKGQELVVGVIHNPITHNLFYAEKGKGAFFNNEKVLVSSDDESKGTVTIASSRDKEIKKLVRNLLCSLPDKIKNERYLGSAALELAYVARGGTEAIFNIGTQTYDFAAGALLVLEAGGKITKLDGTAWEFPDNHFLASNGIVHNTLVEEIQIQIKKLNMNL